MLSTLKNSAAIIWDFDGVIIDSMPVREEAFRHTLASFESDQIERLITYHKANGGWSRYVKFRYFQKEILGVDIDEEQVANWAEDFSNYCKEQLTHPSRLIPVTNQAIAELSGKVPMHVASGSDGVELRGLCDSLGLTPYFLSVSGSPTPKTKLVADIIESYGYPAAETWLIGDSLNDYDAAAANGINFIGFGDASLKAVTPYFWNS